MSSQLNSSLSSLASDGSDFESFGRQQLIDEIKKQSAEYTSENGKINQSLDKMVRRFETDKRKQRFTKRTDTCKTVF